MVEFIKKLLGISKRRDLKVLLNEGATLLDVRTEKEYEKGHISNSINIPLRALSKNLEKIKGNTPIIVVCRGGVRSLSAMNILKNLGYPQVYNGVSWSRFK